MLAGLRRSPLAASHTRAVVAATHPYSTKQQAPRAAAPWSVAAVHGPPSAIHPIPPPLIRSAPSGSFSPTRPRFASAPSPSSTAAGAAHSPAVAWRSVDGRLNVSLEPVPVSEKSGPRPTTCEPQQHASPAADTAQRATPVHVPPPPPAAAAPVAAEPPRLLQSTHPLFEPRLPRTPRVPQQSIAEAPSSATAVVDDAAAEPEPTGVRRGRVLLNAEHPTFGADRKNPIIPDSDRFEGPVTVGGVFVSVAPTLCLPQRAHRMKPNAQLTVRDSSGRASRMRYGCRLHTARGFKLEALIRFQVGWIAPRVKFTELPFRIQLGTGFDVAVPFLFHFAAVSILDERGNSTGSCLFLSGTPLMGFSCGFVRITHGELVHATRRPADPDTETHHFIGHVHFRQLGLLAFKVLAYLACGLAVFVNTKELQAKCHAYLVDLAAPYTASGTWFGAILDRSERLSRTFRLK